MINYLIKDNNTLSIFYYLLAITASNLIYLIYYSSKYSNMLFKHFFTH